MSQKLWVKSPSMEHFEYMAENHYTKDGDDLLEEYPARNSLSAAKNDSQFKTRKWFTCAMSEIRRRLPKLRQRMRTPKTSDDRPVRRTTSSCRLRLRSTTNSVIGIACICVLSALILLRAQSPRMARDRPYWADPEHSANWSIPQRLANFSTEGIRPLSCLSHNDESRAVPLFTGLSYGCLAVEADIWLRENELLVGHDADSLQPDQTLNHMYLEPIRNILEGRTGQPEVRGRIYKEQMPSQAFVLMLDFKSQGSDRSDTLKALQSALHPLMQADLLTYYDQANRSLHERPLTIVASGDVPFDELASESDKLCHDVFFDAPLRWVWESKTGRPQYGREPGKGQGRAGTSHLESAAVFDYTNSYLASMSYKSLYWPPLWGLSKYQREEIKEQIDAAHEKGLKARYWGTWDEVMPAAARRRLWRQLEELGVDVMNVDAIDDFASGTWRSSI